LEKTIKKSYQNKVSGIIIAMQIPVHVSIIDKLNKRYEKRMAPPAAGP